MFLRLQDPDTLARGMDPGPDPSLFSQRCWADWNNACKIKFLRLKIMYLRVSYKKKNIFLHPWSHWRKESDPELDPNPLVRGTDLEIRIRTKCHGYPTLVKNKLSNNNLHMSGMAENDLQKNLKPGYRYVGYRNKISLCLKWKRWGLPGSRGKRGAGNWPKLTVKSWFLVRIWGNSAPPWSHNVIIIYKVHLNRQESTHLYTVLRNRISTNIRKYEQILEFGRQVIYTKRWLAIARHSEKDTEVRISNGKQPGRITAYLHSENHELRIMKAESKEVKRKTLGDYQL